MPIEIYDAGEITCDFCGYTQLTLTGSKSVKLSPLLDFAEQARENRWWVSEHATKFMCPMCQEKMK